MNVYITYSNELRAQVTGVYTSRLKAQKERDKRGDMEIIDKFELNGNFDRNWMDINKDCKHFNKHLLSIANLIGCLYDMEGCLCGGLAHVVVDDDNFEDPAIDFVLNLCEQEENKDKDELELVKLICKELKKLPIQQRALLFSSYYSYRCDNNCENCMIHKGKLSED